MGNAVFVSQFSLGGAGPTVAIKDTIDVAGYPTRAGSRALDNAPRAARHADVVQALLDADCRIVGKTTLHELAYGMSGINPHAGTPLNPRWPDRIPGGSSSGSAVAVASGLARFALGTDTGGSVRLPAACCGVFGMKPTYGRLSRRGVAPAVSSLDCVGPFAPDADTLLRAMQILDPTFASGLPAQRFDLGWVPTAASTVVADAVRSAAEAPGIMLSLARLPTLPDAFTAGMTFINAETWAAFGQLTETGGLAPDVQQRLLAAGQTTPEQLAEAMQIRRRFSLEVDEELRSVDALVLPTLPDFPPTLEQAMSEPRSVLGLSTLVRPFNLSGHPALTVPLRAANGLPIGLQLVGRKGDDALLCRIAQHLQNSVPAVIRQPLCAD